MLKSNIWEEQEQYQRLIKLWLSVIGQLKSDLKKAYKSKAKSSYGVLTKGEEIQLRKNIRNYLKSEDFKNLCGLCELDNNFMINNIKKEFSL